MIEQQLQPGADGPPAQDAEHLQAQVRQQMVEVLQQGPGEAARQATAPTPRSPPPSRWTLERIRASFSFLQDFTLSGVWHLLDRWDLSLRSAVVRHFSPDEQYLPKLWWLQHVLGKSARAPQQYVALFLDEMGYCRWPEAACDWGPAAPAAPPAADPQQSKQGLWRIVGALHAHSGRVHYLENYIVGREQLQRMYDLLDGAYPHAQRIYVIQDNWSVHSHPQVLQHLQTLPRIEPVWLPTYAPWLNPIEKLWRWLRQEVLKLHRLAGDFAALKHRVNGFLDQFSRGSQALLEYVGLQGKGRLAQYLHPNQHDHWF